MRQIVLDTETTGIRVEDGHKIIEIGCLELIDRKLTGRKYHQYINPEREVEAGALAVHGITNEFLSDKPVFKLIDEALMAFIDDAELIIHNAPFDLSFLNAELKLARRGWKTMTDYCNVIDTLKLARQLHAGQRNSLDALCKRYGVDNSKREYHGALLDAYLLANVYLAMTGGQGSFFDELNDTDKMANKSTKAKTAIMRSYDLTVVMATEEEMGAHDQYLAKMKERNQCLWLEHQDNIDVFIKSR
ncbi:MAG: DNA polymerase III subunit epsilon [Gammaproteobacteria bacterium RIFCSPHIGHO2_12_FULL_43_28]|nr:MAG: DNA polymerase III subunit epsilon [Gammaproteobacteria bacterium RIFCSPHIGHO2_12_FULL_43_28]